ncbi:MAG: hypothetical protein ACTSPY_08900 [Candidatus Helarchaeota archaeon]
MRSKKIFLFVGIPILSFYVFLIIIFFAFISAILLLPVIILGLSIIRKKHLYIRLMKFSLGCFLVFFILIPNPLYWPTQIYRRIDKTSIITPNNLLIINLNSTENFWTYLTTNTTYNQSQFNNLSIEEKLEIIQDYILYIVPYSYDINNYYVNMHTATPEEVLIRGKDDCQGRSVVTVSFLQYLGYDAWVAETPFHWYTRVFINDTSYIDLNRGSACEPLWIFNGNQFKFPTPFLECVYNILFHRGDYIASFYMDFINISPIMIWIILIVISFLISLLMISILKYPKKYSNRKWRNQTIYGTVFFYLSLVILYLIGIFNASFFIISIIILLSLYFFTLDREFVLKIKFRHK